MNCLHNYIGIKGCGTAAPEGGYINMLPGITLKSVQGIANSEQVTYVKVWDDIQERAWLRFEKDLRNTFRAKHTLKTVRGFYSLKTIDKGIESDPSTDYKGFVVDSGIDENGLFAFDVSSISIDLPAGGDIEVLLFDRQGYELDRIPYTAVAGLNNIPVAKRYAASLLFVCVNASDLKLKETEMASDMEGYYNLLFTHFGECCSPKLYGAIANVDEPYRPMQSGSTYGLSAKLSPVCDFSSIICQNKDLFKSAWMNLLGVEIMLETLYSERMNRFTTIKGEAAEELRDLFTGQYENDLEEAVLGIRINAEDACIECRQRVTRRERLP